MAEEQVQYEKLNLRLKELQDSGSEEDVQKNISAELSESQSRLADLCSKNMKCLDNVNRALAGLIFSICVPLYIASLMLILPAFIKVSICSKFPLAICCSVH